MQTFLPYSDFTQSAKCLDNKRLGKQRVEAWQILNTLLGHSNGWKNHPCVKMWQGYEYELALYGIAICYEWRLKGFKDSMLDKFKIVLAYKEVKDRVIPKWLGNEEFHASHRSNLLRKDEKWYGQFGWKEPNNLPYVWPIQKVLTNAV